MSKYLLKIVEALENQQYSFIQQDPSCHVFLQSKVCGDKVELFVNLDPNSQRITSLSYQNSSCGLNTMLLEWVCQEFKGKTLTDLKVLTLEFLREKFEFPIGKSHCAQLLLDAIKKL